ncbi:hypothetical protein DPMN_101478 [Dreissena polymorpha]|uniref:Uncharacterized protein n=1 Tax=Dreissena polymorpha TaxID=45954 RepID=A0A9D4R952_DREPO|nr:hypothetical protein DPMN_101478 [Dreissena polymorpha]
MAQQIQLSPSPSSRTSSSRLGLLSSPRCSGPDQSAVYRREFACPYRSRGPVCRGTNTAGQQDHQWNEIRDGLGVPSAGREPMNIKGVGFEEGTPGRRYSVRSTRWGNRLGDEDDSR